MTAQCLKRGCPNPPSRKGYCQGHYQKLIELTAKVNAPPPPMPPRAIHQSKFLYVIGITGNQIFKVGRSGDPVKRMANLQCAIPIDLTLEAAFCVASSGAEKLERSVHRALVRHNVRGEWFKLSKTVIVEEVIECARQIETPIIDPMTAIALCRENTAVTGGLDEIFAFEEKLKRIASTIRQS